MANKILGLEKDLQIAENKLKKGVENEKEEIDIIE